jgi:hypothetical protein
MDNGKLKIDKQYLAALVEREKHCAAVHEAGHFVILTAMGGYGTARIWRNPSKALDERAWFGEVRIYADPAKQNLGHSYKEHFNVITPLPERWRVYFGMAGEIAVCIEDGEDIDGIFNHLLDATDVISETDLRDMGDDWNFDDVAATVEILKARWDSLIAIAGEIKLFPSDS